MVYTDQKVTSVGVLDITEEGAKAIELMFNKVVEEINQHNTPIIYIQVSENHFYIIGR